MGDGGSLVEIALELQLKPCAQPWTDSARDEVFATSESNRAGEVGIVEVINATDGDTEGIIST
jgi:hypothetical protein